MLQATINLSQHTIAIDADGSQRQALRELRSAYKELTGHRAEFSDLEDARRQLAEALATALHGPYTARSRPEGPVAKARRIFARMEGQPRPAILEACEAQGINRNTASTQLSLWTHKKH